MYIRPIEYMNNNPAYRHRRSVRLPGYDYSRPGAYFVTVCVQNRECLFGKIINGKMVLNDAGNHARTCWMDIPNHFTNVKLDEYVIMPNHVHGIIRIFRDTNVRANNHSPLQNRICGTSKTIGSVVRGFKIGVTKWFRIESPYAVVWQRDYYEHIIRNEKSMFQVRQYIRCNPLNWDNDDENPMCKSPRYVAMPNPQRP